MYEPLRPGATLQLPVLLPTGTDCGSLPGDGPWPADLNSDRHMQQGSSLAGPDLHDFTSVAGPQTNGQFTDLVSSPDL